MEKTNSKRRRRVTSSNDYVERSIYDGTKLLGSFAPAKAGFAAYDRKGRRLGAFDDADAARLAIIGASEK